MTSEEKLANDASYFLLASTAGFLDVAEVVEWADGIISKMAQPPIEVIELSLSRSKPISDIDFNLEKLSGPNIEHAMSRLANWALSALKEKQISLNDCLNGFFQLSQSKEFQIPNSDFEFAFYSVREDYYLFTEGLHGTEARVESDLIEVIKRYT